MNKEQAKNIKVGTKLININTCKVDELANIGDKCSYRYRIYENEKDTSDLWNNLDDWYTKEQLKEIKVTPLQAVNLLQNDIFEINDKFTINYINGNTDIIKTNNGIEIISDSNMFNSYTISNTQKCCIFKPYIKPFTKQDLKSGMIVINSDNGIGHIILNSTIGDIIQYNNGYIDNLSNYDDNLVKNCDNSKIDKIYKLKDNYSFNNYDFNDKIRYELLWSRE